MTTNAGSKRLRGVLKEVAIVIAVLLAVQWWQTRGLAGGPAPALDGAGLDGEHLSLEALRGRPALVHFWATWCGVCRAEQGTIASLAKSTPMITVATSSGEAAEVRAWLSERGLQLPVIVDPEGVIAGRFGVQAFPTTFVIGPDGSIRSGAVGYTTWLGLRARLLLAR